VLDDIIANKIFFISKGLENMHRLKSVEIMDLWGKNNFKLDFNRDLNFLIGENGSGKTTVVNLVAATLKLDYPTLERVPFSQITLVLQSEQNEKIFPKIQVIKEIDEIFGNSIKYSVTYSPRKKPDEFYLDDLDEVYAYRRARRSHRVRRRALVEPQVSERTRELVNLSWLSIHRGSLRLSRSDEGGYDSTVETKLDDLSGEFTRYFSKLKEQEVSKTEQFQKAVFLSLLPAKNDVFMAKGFQYEKESLEQIFSSLGLLNKESQKSIDLQFKNLNSAAESVRSKKQIDGNIFTSLFAAQRIHDVVKAWQQLLDEKREIFRDRDNFLEVLNSLLIKKNLRISNENVLEVWTDDGNLLRSRDLSSGEKQLLIVLGEALLHREGPWIYIADEPELSLHINWQLQLVDSVKTINPNAQIVFATHSPEIVSSYDTKVFHMEDLVY